MPKKSRPIRPDEVTGIKKKELPSAVYDSFNELIKANFKDGRAIFSVREALALIGKKGLNSQDVYNENWLDIKEKYQVIGKEKASMVREHIEKAKVLIEHIDSSGQIDDATRAEILHLNTLASLCDKRELDWPIKGWRLNLLNIFRSLLE